MTADTPDAFAAGDRLLSWRQVKDLAGLSRTTAWRLQNAGDFPRPVMISPGRVAWRESEVAAWKAGLSPRGAARPVRRGPPRPPAAAPQPRAAPPPPPVAPTPRRARRRPAVPENQMSFDF